ncbi:ABC transporter related [Elusimicrobium minutum Pei191]|uniref:ABC transporter related n=1 Tax=Elusimicrobium minutum (strain Pei191) TaxID=445932 RepID=B2KDK2_ELUMP|nr:ABC transporter ATP-binding protein [Elusimicrobium minutum]ACC98598.1 ABC transporter related [Elusimicrobium minutum Pei191]
MTNNNENIIEVNNLTIAFGSFKAVDGISFDVKKGEIFGFLGANGAGKTTTIRTICGILNPSSGTVKVNGKDVSSSTAVLKPFISYMSQKFTLYPDLTIKENIYFAGSLYNMSKNKIEQRAKEIFKFINLESDTDSLVKNLPGGIKQMIALGATLLHDPEIVFLDEPTAGTSPSTREDFWKLIKLLAQNGKTIFVTTHYMDEAEYCNRIVLMERGKIIAFDTPENLKKTFFPRAPKQLVFKQPKQAEVRQEFYKEKIGVLAVFGNDLRVEVEDEEKFEILQKKYKDVFETNESAPTLEDVFLKALRQKGGPE